MRALSGEPPIPVRALLSLPKAMGLLSGRRSISLGKSYLDQYDLMLAGLPLACGSLYEVLGRDYKTIKGIQKKDLTGSSTTNIKGTTVARRAKVTLDI